jgi:hypothetical protein
MPNGFIYSCKTGVLGIWDLVVPMDFCLVAEVLLICCVANPASIVLVYFSYRLFFAVIPLRADPRGHAVLNFFWWIARNTDVRHKVCFNRSIYEPTNGKTTFDTALLHVVG